MIEVRNKKKYCKQYFLLGALTYKYGDKSVAYIIKNLPLIVSDLNVFYGVDIPKIEISFIYSRKQFDRIVGRKTPDWLVAITKKNQIFVFSPSVIEKISTHKKRDAKKIIKHEICHIFHGKINSKMATWLDEGVALMVSGQRKEKTFTKDNWSLFTKNFLARQISLAIFSKHEGYKISYWMVKEIVDRLGWGMVSDIIKKDYSKKNFRKKLCVIFKISRIK